MYVGTYGTDQEGNTISVLLSKFNMTIVSTRVRAFGYPMIRIKNDLNRETEILE